MELIKIENNEGQLTVNARDLWEFLEVGKVFNMWIKGRIEQYDFVNGQDYIVTETKTGFRQNVIQKDYHISIDMAKELAMVEKNQKGKEARKYFIECERKLREVTTPQYPIPQTYREALELALEQTKKLEDAAKFIEESKPAIEFHNRVGKAESLISLGDAAKSLGYGRNTFIKMLREMNILQKDCNIPYQRFIQQNLFEVKYKAYVTEEGHPGFRPVTLVTGKGLQYLERNL